MRIRERGSTLEVEDVPVLYWLFGALFVVVGGVFFLGPIGLFTDADRLRWWLRVGISMLGAVALVVGAWQLVNAPRSRLTIDRVAKRARIERLGLRGHTSHEWLLESIAAVELLERTDDEGSPIFQLRLFLRDAEPIPVSPLWSHGREQIEEIARTISSAIGSDTVNVRPEGSASMVAGS